MKCFKCNETVIWQSDFDTEDYGIDEEGIISTYLCSACNSYYEVTTIFDNE